MTMVGIALGAECGGLLAGFWKPTVNVPALRATYLPWMQDSVAPEPAEQTGFHLLFTGGLLGGVLCGAWVNRRVRPLSPGSLAVLALASSALAAVVWALTLHDFARPPFGRQLVVSAVALALNAALAAWLLRSSASGPPAECEGAEQERDWTVRGGWWGWQEAVVALALVAVLVTPRPSAWAACWWRDESWHHWAYFILGPGLHRLAGLLPGVDFYTQYGLGPPAVYSLWSRLAEPPTPAALIVPAQLIFVLYYWLLYQLGRVLLGTRIGGIGLVFVALGLRLSAASLAFSWPSSTALRCPFDVPIALLLTGAVARRPPAACFAALLSAVATFWITDLGLGVTLATFLVLGLWWRARLLPLQALAGAALCYVGVLVLLVAVAYGPRMLSPWALAAALSPLRFAAELTALPIFCTPRGMAPSMVCGVLSPALLCLLLALGVLRFRRTPATGAYWVFWGLYGFLAYHLYLNRSATFNWFHFASLPTAMATFLLLSDTCRAAEGAVSQRVHRVGFAALAGLVLTALVAALLMNRHATAMLQIQGKHSPRTIPADPWAQPYDRSVNYYGDVLGERYDLVREGAAAIARTVPARERACVISSIDTEYCRLARRAPFFYFTPLYQNMVTRACLEQALDSLRRDAPERVFTDTRLAPEVTDTSLKHDVVEPLMAYVREHYHLEGSAGYLDIWRRTQRAAQ